MLYSFYFLRMYQLVDFYAGSMEGINEINAQQMIDMMTDSYFLFGTYKTIEYMQNQNMTVYQYVLSYEYSNGNGFGVPHAEDITYIFDPPFGSSLVYCCNLRYSFELSLHL